MTSAYKSIIWDSKNGILALSKEINPLIENLTQQKGKKILSKNRKQTALTERQGGNYEQ